METDKDMKIEIRTGSAVFRATLGDNATAAAFREMLPLTIEMDDVNRNEKYSLLGRNLPASAVKPGTIHTGDLMLWGSDGLVLFYKTFQTSYGYTPLGKIDNPAGLESALGPGTVTVSFILADK